MKVLVLYSKSGYLKYKNSFDKLKNIVDSISGIKRLQVKSSSEDKLLHNKNIKRLIFESDILIIDNSENSFTLGHEATIAVLKGKPVLVLSQNRDYSNYIEAPNFFARKYKLLELEEIVINFLNLAKRRIYSERFNMYISKDQIDFLQKEANKEKTSMSEIVRKAINEYLKNSSKI